MTDKIEVPTEEQIYKWSLGWREFDPRDHWTTEERILRCAAQLIHEALLREAAQAQPHPLSELLADQRPPDDDLRRATDAALRDMYDEAARPDARRQRFSADDPERPKFIRDAALDSDDRGLEVVGWWPEGDASRYADEIAAMLNEAVRLRRDAEPTAAARDVLAERKRQIEAEGWTPEHDDENESSDMARAAACYALSAAGYRGDDQAQLRFWPWLDSWWKPTTPRRDLVKAGALILAEIERLDRAAEREGE